jgi:hypothetical protein
MDKLTIKSTYTTPQVDFDPDKGLFEIEGRIITEDAEIFFVKILSWLDEYSSNIQKPVVVRFRLFYYNTSSSKGMIDVMRRFDMLYEKGADIKIVWEYENEDEDAMLDGEDFKRFLKIPFKIIKI